MPNGSCPPRTPKRIGVPNEPISAPTDQLNVSCTVESALPPVAAAAQLRHITVPARLAWVPARQSTPAPYVSGSSLLATSRPPRSARSLVSDRTQPAKRKSRVTSSSRLAEPPVGSSVRHEVPPAILALMRRASASDASVRGENGSNGANAPPVVRARTLSHLPGVPRPLIPNCESCAARWPAARSARHTSAAVL